MDKLICDEVNYLDDDLFIYSLGCKIFIREKIHGGLVEIILPKSRSDLPFQPRIIRRLLRTNKCNILRIDEDKIFILRQFKCFIYDLRKQSLVHVLSLDRTRNVMANSVCQFGDEGLIFGDYYSNDHGGDVYLHFSFDGYNFDKIKISNQIPMRHIHNVQYFDEIERYFVCTGDYDGQCWLIELDHSLEICDVHGDGTQTFRTCSINYYNGSLWWGMDSPLEDSHLIEYDYKTKNLVDKFAIPGPCLYSVLRKNELVLSTSSEPSMNKICPSLGLFNMELKTFTNMIYLKKDFWPYIFKFGAIALKSNSDKEFWCNFEGISGLDSRSINISSF